MERTDFKFSVIRDTLAGKDNVLTVTELCGIAGVSRSGYYTWLRAEQTRRAREAREQADFQLILAACRFRGYDNTRNPYAAPAYRRADECEENSASHEKIQPFLSDPKGKSVPPDAKSDPDKLHRRKSGKPRV